LKVGSWFVSTHPSSHFVTNLMAARVTDDARWNLADRNLTVHQKGETEKIPLDDAAAVIEVLIDRFGINVADVGERSVLEARIDRLPDAQPVSHAP
jgi:arylamine N-acetyltransferase